MCVVRRAGCVLGAVHFNLVTKHFWVLTAGHFHLVKQQSCLFAGRRPACPEHTF